MPRPAPRVAPATSATRPIRGFAADWGFFMTFSSLRVLRARESPVAVQLTRVQLVARGSGSHASATSDAAQQRREAGMKLARCVISVADHAGWAHMVCVAAPGNVPAVVERRRVT